MGIGILIILVGSLLYKGRNMVQKALAKYRNRKKNEGPNGID